MPRLWVIGTLLVAAAAAQSPALRQGVSVPMPVTSNAVAMPDADRTDSVVVSLTLRGTVFFDATSVPPAALSGKVKAALEGDAGKRIYLKADERAPYSAVAEVLDALRTGGVRAPILLTDQHATQQASGAASYAPPMGLDVQFSPPVPSGAQVITLQGGDRQASDAEVRKQAQGARPIVLQADGAMPFGDVVHAIDVCRGAGAPSYLATSGKQALPVQRWFTEPADAGTRL